jgi:hypothetical protein
MTMQKEHLEVLLEDIKGKFDLVLEGNYTIWQEVRETRQELSEKIEMNSILIKALNKKIDDVATDLAAHCADTESYRKEYKVSER